MVASGSSPRAFTFHNLLVACAKEFGMAPDDVRRIASKLYEKAAISYPLTNSGLLWDRDLQYVDDLLEALSKWYPELGKLAERVDPKYISPAWVDEHEVKVHCGIRPQLYASRPRLSEKENKVFQLIAARFMALFIPDYAWETEPVYRLFTRIERVEIKKKLFGKDVVASGAGYYVSGESLFVAVDDGAEAVEVAWLVIPTSCFLDFCQALRFQNLEVFLQNNPQVLEHLVGSANLLMLPDGEGLWSQQDGVMSADGSTCFYHWPAEHLSLATGE
jgi:hypothetical protein